MSDIFGISNEIKEKAETFFKEINELKSKHKDLLKEKDTFVEHILFHYPSNNNPYTGLGFNEAHLPVLPQYIKDEIISIFNKHYPKA